MTERQIYNDITPPNDIPLGHRRRSRSVRIITAIVGVSVGVLCLLLVLRSVDVGDLKAALLEADSTHVALAVVAFWFSIGLRIVRWYQFLLLVVPIRRRQVAESAIVGYAASIVMPARLGEPFRAEYTQRRFHLDRFAVFGSIITERLIDAIAVVVILLIGLVLVARTTLVTDFSLLSAVATAASGIIAATVAILVVLHFRGLAGVRFPVWLDGPIRRLLYGVASLNHQNLASVFFLTLLIWVFEAGALWAIFRSLGTNLSVAELFVLLGIATLSTLVPAAPGYVGSLQLVFGVGMVSLKLPAATGVLAATLVQLLFYGSLIVAATLVVILRRRPGAARHSLER